MRTGSADKGVRPVQEVIMKFYIAGMITGDKKYKRRFRKAERQLRKKGHSVMNPAWLVESPEFSYEDYIFVSGAMQERCEAVFFLKTWKRSPGANGEFVRATLHRQRIFFQMKAVPRQSRTETCS